MHHLISLNKIKKKKEELYQVNLQSSRTIEACKELAIPLEDIQYKKFQDFQDNSQLPEVCKLRYDHWRKRYKRFCKEIIKYKTSKFLKKEIREEEKIKKAMDQENQTRNSSQFSVSSRFDTSNQLRNIKPSNQPFTLSYQESSNSQVPKLSLREKIESPNINQLNNSDEVIKGILLKQDFSTNMLEKQIHEKRTQNQNSEIYKNKQYLKLLKDKFMSYQSTPKVQNQIKKLDIPLIEQAAAKMKEELNKQKQKFSPKQKKKLKKRKKNKEFHYRSLEDLNLGQDRFKMSFDQYYTYLNKVKTINQDYEGFLLNYLQSQNQQSARFEFNRENLTETKLKFAKSDSERVKQIQTNKRMTRKKLEQQGLIKMQNYIEKYEAALNRRYQITQVTQKSQDESFITLKKRQEEIMQANLEKKLKQKEKRKLKLQSHEESLREERRKLQLENVKKNQHFLNKIKVSFYIRIQRSVEW